jgi:hypothetical protein
MSHCAGAGKKGEFRFKPVELEVCCPRNQTLNARTKIDEESIGGMKLSIPKRI